MYEMIYDVCVVLFFIIAPVGFMMMMANVADDARIHNRHNDEEEN